MSRAEKLRALQSALSGNVSALQHYGQASRPPVLLIVQKGQGNQYSIKPDSNRPDLPAGILTESEFEAFTDSLRKRHEPVICMIRPQRTPDEVEQTKNR